jgi:hypothetical protein
MTSRTATYPEAKAKGGQQHVDQSRKFQKACMIRICKSCAQGETGTVEPKFSHDDAHIRHTMSDVATLE